MTTEYLNPDIFNESVKRVSTRKGFGEGLLELGERDERVVVLCADLTDSTESRMFADRFPDRFVQVGVAEQNLATVASGMASMGKIPFITSYAIFSPGRNWEQVRTTICYNNQPVKIVGSHVGVTVGPDGGSHQALEDIAITRVIPRMTVISPCDALEAKRATLALGLTDTPVYIRLARNKTPVITTEETEFEIGKASLFYGGRDERADVGIVATGPLVHRAMLVAKRLESESGIKVKVLNLSTIKPLDEEALLELAKETGAFVTVEEHQKAGGMGSAVSEFLSRSLPTPMEFVGVDDSFGESGEDEELLDRFGMSEESISGAVFRVIERKVNSQPVLKNKKEPLQ